MHHRKIKLARRMGLFATDLTWWAASLPSVPARRLHRLAGAGENYIKEKERARGYLHVMTPASVYCEPVQDLSHWMATTQGEHVPPPWRWRARS